MNCSTCIYFNTPYCEKYQTIISSFISKENQREYIPYKDCDAYQEGKYNNQIFYLDTAYFHIPDFYIVDNILQLLEIQKEFPGMFMSNFKILEIYGAFAGCLWNGRSPLFDKPFLAIQDINTIKDKIEQAGLSINFTWNNHLIQGNQLFDTYCNTITEIFNNSKHSITVASSELYDYLKTNFPNYTYYKSIIDAEHIKQFEIDEKFDIQIISTQYNNNWELLNTIPEECRNRIELLCNDICAPFCTKRDHYDVINECLSHHAKESTMFNNHCPNDHLLSFSNNLNNSKIITPSQIDTYVKNGFHHFKLAGRGDDTIILLYKICKYFVKPEYFEDVYFRIIGV